MENRREELTEAKIAAAPLADEGQYLMRDTKLSGFFVVVGKKSKTYTVQGDLWRNRRRIKTCRVALGRFGTITLKKARRDASEALAAIARGEDPSEPARRRGGVTLQDAWNSYRETLEQRGRSQRTIDGYKDAIERLLKDWLALPLAELGADRRLVRKRHRTITTKHGPYAANGVMRALRAVYRHEMRADPELPPCPVIAVEWNEEERRDTALGRDDLAEWWSQLQDIENPVRREFHLFVLLSGHRPGALKQAQWQHLNVAERVLHIPAPKGGKKRAFDIPLSLAMLRCLWRARQAGRAMHPAQARDWIFPAASESGHIAEHKEDRDELSHWAISARPMRRTRKTLACPSLW